MNSFNQAGTAGHDVPVSTSAIHQAPAISTDTKVPNSKAPKIKMSRPALRLISTNGLSHDSWLNVRKQGIGSSDAAAAVGLNPYQSMLELWMVKTGRDGNMPKPEPDDESSPMYWGKILEPIVAQHYSKRTGHKVRRINAVLQHPDPDKSWMLANLDYVVVAGGQADRENQHKTSQDNPSQPVHILECKTAGEHGARLWKHGVPEYIQCQVQHQLAVTGKQAADVCVLVCGQEIRIYRIERDDELIDRLIQLERRFWHYVETDTAPPADGSESAAQALQYLYPKDSGETIDFRDNPAMGIAFTGMLKLKSEIELKQSAQDQLKQQIQQAMGNATKALFNHGTVTWKKSSDSTTLDSKRLLKIQPSLLRRYPLYKSGSRRFMVYAD
jgi:putative phage-type endonuclease